MRTRRLVLPCLVLVLYLTAAVGAQERLTGEQRLAGELVRVTRAMLAPSPEDLDNNPETPPVSRPLSVEVVESCLILMEMAGELSPDDLEIWRLVLELAILGEDAELVDQAVRALVRIDPEDERVRLMRLNRVVDRLQTVDERIAVYEQLLTPEQIKRIGAPVASRLAFDLSLLYQRKGDPEKYAHWLAEATAVDSANPTAAGAATGYFIDNVADEYAQVELLTNMLISNPTDPGTQVTLAETLLGYGAYDASARIYDLAVNTSLADKRAVTEQLYADQAIAHWAAGNLTKALRTISDRQSAANQRARFMAMRQAREDGQEQILLDFAGERGHLPPTIATVRAAILEDDPDRGKVALDQVVVTAEYTINSALEQGRDIERINDLRLQIARIVLWLGGDLDLVKRYLSESDATTPLRDEQRCAIDAWIAFREGDLEAAAELFAQCDEHDPAVLLGLAELELARGDQRAAARHLLQVAREQAGTVVGIAALNQLAEIIGQRPPISDLARRLEALIDTVSSLIDRYPNDPTLAVSLRVEPLKRRYEVYEPITIAIQITNRSILPLAIDPSGPIKTQVLLAPTLQIPRVRDRDLLGKDRGEPKPLVVDIGRRLRLDPGETVEVIVDLRRTSLGHAMNLRPFSGGSLRLKGIFNIVTTRRGALVGGIYGSEVDTSLIRLDGVRVDAQWVTDAVERLRGDDPDPVDVALLAHVVVLQSVGQLLAEEAELVAQANSARAEAFGRLDPVSQAWVLAVMPRMPQNEPLLSITRKSDNRYVKVAYLLFHLAGPKDPMLAAAGRDEDPFVSRLAEMRAAALSQFATQVVTPPKK